MIFFDVISVIVISIVIAVLWIIPSDVFKAKSKHLADCAALMFAHEEFAEL
jgi:hypothetical protein